MFIDRTKISAKSMEVAQISEIQARLKSSQAHEIINLFNQKPELLFKKIHAIVPYLPKDKKELSMYLPSYMKHIDAVVRAYIILLKVTEQIVEEYAVKWYTISPDDKKALSDWSYMLMQEYKLLYDMTFQTKNQPFPLMPKVIQAHTEAYIDRNIKSKNITPNIKALFLERLTGAWGEAYGNYCMSLVTTDYKNPLRSSSLYPIDDDVKKILDKTSGTDELYNIVGIQGERFLLSIDWKNRKNAKPGIYPGQSWQKKHFSQVMSDDVPWHGVKIYLPKIHNMNMLVHKMSYNNIITWLHNNLHNYFQKNLKN